VRIAAERVVPRVHPYIEQARNIGIRLRKANSRTKTRDAAISKARQRFICLIEGQRDQHIEVVIHDLESTRHHPGDHARLGIDDDSAPYDAWVAAESAMPIAIAQHHPPQSMGVLISRCKPLASEGGNIQRLKN